MLNNSNFGIDCRNNIDNCILEPLFDDFEEISYIKKFTTVLFDEIFCHFYSPALVREEIIQTYQSKTFELEKEDPLYEVIKKYYERKMDEELDDVNCFEKNKYIKKRKLKNIEEKITDCLDPRKTKMSIDFNIRELDSIKSFAVKKRDKIKVTTRFMSGKLLMFAKLSLKSFIYDVAEIFCFPDQTVAEIYKKYMIENVVINHILTDTDSTALQFTFISDPNSDLPEDNFIDVIFEVIIATKIIRDLTLLTNFEIFLDLGKKIEKKS